MTQRKDNHKMNNMDFDALSFVVGLCAFLITACVIPYLRSITDNARFAQLADVVETAVFAVEQVRGRGHGLEKKAEVVSVVAQWLSKCNRNLKVTPEQLDQLIESAVYGINQAKEIYRDGDKDTAK